jgi:plastocyanin
MAHEHDEDADIRQSRRRLLRYAMGGAGLLALSGSGVISLRQTIAKDGDDDDDDDDNSGHGSGGDDNSGHGADNSGHGNGHDDDDDDDGDETVAVTGEIPAGSIQITIVSDDAYGFSPSELTVDLGQTVTFVNAHHDPHTATGSGFDTGIMQPGQTATVVLDKPGRFAYACQFHPEMTGSIAVHDADGQIPEPKPSQSSAAPADATAIQITNFTFDPPTISIATGTIVVWTNNDTVPHTVTALDGAFDSAIFDPEASFTWEFTNPGSYAYRCDLHPQMQATIEVTGEPVTASNPVASPVAATPEATPITPTATLEPALTPVASTSEPVTVTISNFAFDPPIIDISVGTAVTWMNQDSVPHTATDLDASFDTGRLDLGQEGSITFDTTGSFDYRCSFHPSMLGTVVVT